jgi:hypothetical protein
MVLSDLLRVEGLQHVIAVTGGTKSYYNHPDKAQELQAVAASAIARNPEIANTPLKVVPNFPNAQYDPKTGTILLGICNPAALAHEIEHLHNLSPKGMYQKLIGVTQGLTRINNVAAIPAVLALRAFIKDPVHRNDILNTLAGVSSAIAAPGITEEMSASVSALKNNPNRLAAMKTLMPALMAHVAQSMAPSLIYQLGRR